MTNRKPKRNQKSKDGCNTVGLSLRQSDVKRFIVKFKAEHGGISPTYRQIAAAIGVSSQNAVLRHMVALRKKGHIAWKPNTTRTMEVTL